MTDRFVYFEEYAKGWETHDLQRVMEQFAANGTYLDPVVGEPVVGDEIKHYFEQVSEGFPDLSFEGRVVRCRDPNLVINEWTGTGTNVGSYFGGPPTGRSITLDGASIFTISGDGIEHIANYFDRRSIQQQLGLTFPKIIGMIPELLYWKFTRRS